jgi:hypothetical protein
MRAIAKYEGVPKGGKATLCKDGNDYCIIYEHNSDTNKWKLDITTQQAEVIKNMYVDSAKGVARYMYWRFIVEDY